MFNKSLTTNLVALGIIAISYLLPKYDEIVYLTGLFALSGGITNWLAIHMLFEKVPFLYGSGVIPNRFEEFKLGIKQLVMTEFFTPQNINVFAKQQSEIFATGIKFKITNEKDLSALTGQLEELFSNKDKSGNCIVRIDYMSSGITKSLVLGEKYKISPTNDIINELEKLDCVDRVEFIYSSMWVKRLKYAWIWKTNKKSRR